MGPVDDISMSSDAGREARSCAEARSGGELLDFGILGYGGIWGVATREQK